MSHQVLHHLFDPFDQRLFLAKEQANEHMNSPEFKTDFDVYQFGKEGLPENVAELATEEAKLYNTTDIQTDVDVNGITVAR